MSKQIISVQNKETNINKVFENYSLNTQKAYKSDISSFITLTGKSIQNATIIDITNYIKQLEGKGYKNATINRKINSLSKVFSVYQNFNLIETNPISELKKIKKITKKVSKEVRTALTIDDIQSVIQDINKTSIIIKTLANTGLRVSELINIKASDIKDLNNGFISIRINGKGNKERYITIGNKLYTEIKKVYNNTESNYLFHSQKGNKLNRNNLYTQIKRQFKKIVGKDITPHDLRHFFATYKIDNEKKDIKAVSLYLGHSTTSITLDMYVNTSLKANETEIIQ